MLWDGFELGPVLGAPADGELRLAFDLTRREAVCLRFHAWVAGPTVRSTPQPETPSPHLARVIEVRVQGNEAWVERELCFGPTLETLVGRGRTDPSTVAGIAAQVLEGLRDLHAAGGAHGTLSPSAIVFDLTSGRVRLADLEVARLDLPPSDDAAPYQNVAVGQLPSPHGDLLALGRICEALLLGQRPVKESSSGSLVPPASQGLWRWARRFEAETEDGPPFTSAEDALEVLRRLGLASETRASLPAGDWTRRHAAALTILEQWRRSPPTAAAQEAPLTYGQLRSSLHAEVWWRRIGVAGVAVLLLSTLLGLRPVHGTVGGTRAFGEAACLERARPAVVADSTSPEGRVRSTLKYEPGTAVALDGCPLSNAETEGDSGGTAGGFWVQRGRHELRAEQGDSIVDQTIDLAVQGEGTIDLAPLLAAAPRPDTETEAALTRFVEETRAMLHEGLPAVEDGGAASVDPLFWGMIEPQAQWLIAADARAVAPDPALRSSLPDSLALALGGLRAAKERFSSASVTCLQKLRAAAALELASGQPTATPGAPELVAAAVLMASARTASVQLVEPLRVEQRGLQRLRVSPSPKLNRTVDALVGTPELVGCLEGLLPFASDVDEMAVRTLVLLDGE